MKKLFAGLVLSLVMAVPGYSQTRLLAGVQGGESFSNTQFGVTGQIELPISNFEVNLKDNFSPFEEHTALGSGYANLVRVSGIDWFSDRVGLTGSFQNSTYSVTAVSKSSFYFLGGSIFKVYTFGFPSRIELDYMSQFANGVNGSGVESSHLRGGLFKLDTRVGCNNRACFRFQEEFTAGRVLLQGNPVCDGSYGNGSQAGLLPCPRPVSVGGGVTASFVIEFGKHGSDEDLF